jgi:hypothetical protein
MIGAAQRRRCLGAYAAVGMALAGCGSSGSSNPVYATHGGLAERELHRAYAELLAAAK